MTLISEGCSTKACRTCDPYLFEICGGDCRLCSGGVEGRVVEGSLVDLEDLGQVHDRVGCIAQQAHQLIVRQSRLPLHKAQASKRDSQHLRQHNLLEGYPDGNTPEVVIELHELS